MIDAYAHLLMAASDPLADLQAQLDSAALQGALVVETWNGDNQAILEGLIDAPSARFRVGLCYREDRRTHLLERLKHPAVSALRVRTADLDRLEDLLEVLVETGKWLLPHAERGIGLLSDRLIELAVRHPRLKIYLPHLGWPRCEGEDDRDWVSSINQLAALPGAVIGVSAIVHFSREPFPHADVAAFAARAIALFGSRRAVAASDYPLLPVERYAEYINLAVEWIEAGRETTEQTEWHGTDGKWLGFP
jgi:hypothetical protein